MDVISIIMNAAKMAGVNAALLVAICNHESAGFKLTYAPYDRGSPSFGVCQIKESTANFVGFRGTSEELMDPKVNAKYAALYLKYQQGKYGEDDWIKLVSSYNAGSYVESTRVPKCPRNLKYLRSVQKRLLGSNRDRLNCGSKDEFRSNQ